MEERLQDLEHLQLMVQSQGSQQLEHLLTLLEGGKGVDRGTESLRWLLEAAAEEGNPPSLAALRYLVDHAEHGDVGLPQLAEGLRTMCALRVLGEAHENLTSLHLVAQAADTVTQHESGGDGSVETAQEEGGFAELQAVLDASFRFPEPTTTTPETRPASAENRETPGVEDLNLGLQYLRNLLEKNEGGLSTLDALRTLLTSADETHSLFPSPPSPKSSTKDSSTAGSPVLSATHDLLSAARHEGQLTDALSALAEAANTPYKRRKSSVTPLRRLSGSSSVLRQVDLDTMIVPKPRTPAVVSQPHLPRPEYCVEWLARASPHTPWLRLLHESKEVRNVIHVLASRHPNLPFLKAAAHSGAHEEPRKPHPMLVETPASPTVVLGAQVSRNRRIASLQILAQYEHWSSRCEERRSSMYKQHPHSSSRSLESVFYNSFRVSFARLKCGREDLIELDLRAVLQKMVIVKEEATAWHVVTQQTRTPRKKEPCEARRALLPEVADRLHTAERHGRSDVVHFEDQAREELERQHRKCSAFSPTHSPVKANGEGVQPPHTAKGTVVHDESTARHAIVEGWERGVGEIVALEVARRKYLRARAPLRHPYSRVT